MERSNDKIQVLYIFPLDRDYTAVKALPKSIDSRYQFHFIDSKHFSYSSKASDEFSLIKFIDECIDKVGELSIDIVLSTRDMADLVHAVISNKFGHIKGCDSYLSSFMALYKPYTRMFVDVDSASKSSLLQYEVVNTKDQKWDCDTVVESLIKKLNGQGFMKPPAASCSSLVGDFNTTKKFKSLLKMHSKHGKIFNHYLPAFVNQYIPDSYYTPQEISDTLLIEEFVDTPIKVTVDGCVVDQQIYIWSVIDSLYWTDINKNECFIGCSVPSNLNKNICDELTQRYKAIVNRLIDTFGFNNQFIDCEFFVQLKNKSDFVKCSEDVDNWRNLEVKNVSIKLMEINGRPFMQMAPIYKKVFNGDSGDILMTLLKMYDRNITDKNKIQEPQLLNGIWGLNGYLSTFASGISDDLFDFQSAQKYVDNGTVILAVKKQEIIETVSQQGSLLAYANVTGKSYKDCKQKMVQIGKELVKQGAPWQLDQQPRKPLGQNI